MPRERFHVRIPVREVSLQFLTFWRVTEGNERGSLVVLYSTWHVVVASIFTMRDAHCFVFEHEYIIADIEHVSNTYNLSVFLEPLDNAMKQSNG